MRRPFIRLLWPMVCLGAVIGASTAVIGQTQSLTFVGTKMNFDGRVGAAVTDINGDGWFEPLGSLNDKTGNLSVPQGSLSTYFQGIGLGVFNGLRRNRDTRIADFNGDRVPDMVANTYNCIQDLNSKALLFIGQSDGTFTSNTAASTTFANLDLKGHGETIVTADFDNDGDLDLYFPFYTFAPAANPAAPPAVSECWDADPNNDEGHYGNTATASALLRNNGQGAFTNQTANSGVGLTAADVIGGDYRGEGAQAADINNDGWIDFYVGNRLFINNKNFTFTDFNVGIGASCPSFPSSGFAKLPVLFDEGVRFVDWNNDGYLDILLHHSTLYGPRLFEFNGSCFKEVTTTSALQPLPAGNTRISRNYGISAYDLDNDGDEDIVLHGAELCVESPTLHCDPGFPTNMVFRNNGGAFSVSLTVDGFRDKRNGRGGLTFADINRDGRIDILYPENGDMWYFRNTTTLAAGAGSFTIELLGPNGERNQFGRVVEITRPSGVKMARVVDGGSGQLSQGQYPLLVGTPEAGAHTIKARFQPTTANGPVRVVQFTIQPGQSARVLAPTAANSGTVTVGYGWMQPLLRH